MYPLYTAIFKVLAMQKLTLHELSMIYLKQIRTQKTTCLRSSVIKQVDIMCSIKNDKRLFWIASSAKYENIGLWWQRWVSLFHHFMSQATPPGRSFVPLCCPSTTLVPLPPALTPVFPRELGRVTPAEPLFLSSGSGDRRTLSRSAWVGEYPHEYRAVTSEQRLTLQTFPSSNSPSY
jgi:hypothetical protein